LSTRRKNPFQKQRLMLDQQRELAEVKGMLKAMVALQGKAK
jgi:hypothetical protein